MTTMGGAPPVDCLVVGGGVIGLTIADRLAGEGLSVRVLEAEGVGQGASGAAAGMLAPISEAEPERPLFSLGLSSLREYPALCARLKETTGIDAEFETSGLLQLAVDAEHAESLRERMHRIESVTTSKLSHHDDYRLKPLEWLDAHELRTLSIGVAPEVAGGFFSPDEAHLRPPLLGRALEESARQRGVQVDTGVRVHGFVSHADRIIGVETSAGRIEAAMTVLAAGAWTPSILKASDLEMPAIEIVPVRGQILSLGAPLPAMRMIAWAQDAYFVPKRDGSWIVGATQERVGFDRSVTAEGVAWLLDRVQSVFPQTRGASFSRVWAGLRPVSPDGLPYVGKSEACEGLIMAAGHGRNGVLLAPITAQIVADLMLGKDPGPAAVALSPNRIPA